MAETRNLLLEIGTEEIPARFCAPALEQLKQNAVRALTDARLDFTVADTFGTPRRLVLYVKDLALVQRDVDMVVKGPSKKVAFDAAGNPTVPAQKFAQGQGVSVEELEVRPDEKGIEYVYAHKRVKGESVAKVLPPLLAALVTSIDWPKSMRWADRSIRYARPIKWILALLGESRVPFDVDGIETVATTRGHRVLGPAEPILVRSADDYFTQVARGYVMVDQNVRKQVIWQQITAEAARVGGHVVPDDALLEELTWLVEQPTAFAGSFAPAYLDVPPEVLVTTMKANQRYFPVYAGPSGEDELLPFFIAVHNGERDHIDIVRAGNEKVLAARFADARFFWDEDRKQPLAAFNNKLKEMVFQEKLGTQFRRVERLVGLAREIAKLLDLSPAEQEQAAQAAWLCKADLATKMVFEFPEVQGYMGKQYLLREGGDPAVAEAIYEHYLPRGAGDDLPRTKPGIVVALADRLDMLAGYFGIGLIPTGSQDPFALRRAAQGVVQTIVENGLKLDLGELCDLALGQYAFEAGAALEALTQLMEFFKARVRVLMEGRDLRYDVIDAVLAAGFRDVADAVRRAEVLNGMLAEEEFAAVTGAFKRIANLAGKATGLEESADIDPDLFTEPAERELYAAFVDLRPDMKRVLDEGQYQEFYRMATRLKGPVDAFLDNVRVNVDDEKVRANRYALLHALGGLLSAPADLSKLAG